MTTLDAHLCFSLYVCSKEAIKQYRQPLAKFHLTFTQYIVMMVLWEQDGISKSAIGKKVHLDSGTLAPLLKRLEKMALIKRVRVKENERQLSIQLTQKGRHLKDEMKDISHELTQVLKMDQDNTQKLKELLDELMDTL